MASLNIYLCHLDCEIAVQPSKDLWTAYSWMLAAFFVYIDDILVFSESEEQHYNDFEKVRPLLEENNLKISIDKCQFYKSNIEFWGYNTSAEGLKPTAQKVKDIKKTSQNQRTPNRSDDSWEW